MPKVKRKNPNADKYFDKIENTLIKYDTIFKTIYKLGKWQSCKKVIIYYFTFLQYIKDQIWYVITTSKHQPISTDESSMWYNHILINGLKTKTGREYRIGPIVTLFSDLDWIKESYEKHGHFGVEEKLEKRLEQFYEILEINYKELLKDIRQCI